MTDRNWYRTPDNGRNSPDYGHSSLTDDADATWWTPPLWFWVSLAFGAVAWAVVS